MFKILSLIFVLIAIISNCVDAQYGNNGYRNYPVRSNNNYPINWCECEYPRRYNRRNRYTYYDNDFNTARPTSNNNFNIIRPMNGNSNPDNGRSIGRNDNFNNYRSIARNVNSARSTSDNN